MHFTTWIKASKSGANGGCVEMRQNGENIELRHSKHPNGPFLTYTRTEIDAWLDGAKKGEFDHLLD